MNIFHWLGFKAGNATMKIANTPQVPAIGREKQYSIYEYRRRRYPHPGVGNYAFHSRIHNPLVSIIGNATQYMSHPLPISGFGQFQAINANAPALTQVGLQGVITGEMVTQPLYQQSEQS